MLLFLRFKFKLTGTIAQIHTSLRKSVRTKITLKHDALSLKYYHVYL